MQGTPLLAHDSKDESESESRALGGALMFLNRFPFPLFPSSPSFASPSRTLQKIGR